MPWFLRNIIDDGITDGRGVTYIIAMGIIMILTAPLWLPLGFALLALLFLGTSRVIEAIGRAVWGRR